MTRDIVLLGARRKEIFGENGALPEKKVDAPRAKVHFIICHFHAVSM